MFLFFVVLICIALIRIRFCRFNDEYLSVYSSTSVKGLFIAIVFLSHVRGYIQLDGGILDTAFVLTMNTIGQLMVAMFFFYSGYGCFRSFMVKPEYEKNFFRRRIIKTWVHFVLALPLYLIINLALGITYPLKDYFLSIIGWKSIGNSNWFVFVILVLYIIILLSFNLFGRNDYQKKILSGLLMTIILMFLLYESGKESWWYNTALCFPSGVAYAFYKDRVEKIVLKGRNYYIIFAVTVCAFAALYLQGSMIAYCLCAPAFCLIIVMVTMKIRFGNAIMFWLGDNLFEIYIFQRIPMILMEQLGVVNKYVFVIVSFVFTAIVSIGFKQLEKQVDSQLVQ